MDVSTRRQLWKDMAGNVIEKGAELGGTYDMPHAVSPSKKTETPVKKAIPHTGSIKIASVAPSDDDILKQAFGHSGAPDASPDDNELELHEPEQAPRHPQAKTLKPRVDVSGKEPPKLVMAKKAQYYAVPSRELYPLDGYDQVKQASAYFDEYAVRMTPELKREFCQHLVKRASVLGIPVSEDAEHYGSESYGSVAQLKVAFDARRSVLRGSFDPLHEDEVIDTTHLDVLNKLAAAQPTLYPEAFAEALRVFDKNAGLDQHYGVDVPDPYYSTFAKKAATQESEVDPKDSYLIGNEYLTHRSLVQFSKGGQAVIGQRFGDEFAKKFAKSPGPTFSSLPRDQKLVVMRMANTTNDSPRQGASAS